MLKDVFRFLAEEILISRHVEYYLQWCWNLLRTHGSTLQGDSLPHMESLRALIRAVGSHEKEIMKMSDENTFSLEFLSAQCASTNRYHAPATGSDDMDEDEDDGDVSEGRNDEEEEEEEDEEEEEGEEDEQEEEEDEEDDDDM